MKFSATFVSVCALFLIMFTVPALCDEIEIDIAPSTLNLAYQGTIVTVHTDIDYSLVSGASVTLNDIEIAWWKEDNRGNFVAKFDSDAVKDIVEPGTATLTLEGSTIYGESFTGTSTIRVVDVSGRQ